MIGFVTGLVAEARLLRGFAVEVGGGTPQGAERAARLLLNRGAHALVSFGLAGGLDPALRPGTIIVPAAIVAVPPPPTPTPNPSPQGGGENRVSPPPCGEGSGVGGGATVVPAHFATDADLSVWLGGVTHARMTCAAGIVATVSQKAALLQLTGASAVDLESGAVARIARDAGVAFAALRAICDPAEADVPPAALIALDQTGAIGPASIARSLLARPGQLPALIRLARDAARARAALVRRVDDLRVRGGLVR